MRNLKQKWKLLLCMSYFFWVLFKATATRCVPQRKSKKINKAIICTTEIFHAYNVSVFKKKKQKKKFLSICG